MTSHLLPVFLDVQGALVVVTGTTPASVACAQRFGAMGARVRLVSRGVSPASDPGVERVDAAPSVAHLAGAVILVAGSADAADDAPLLAAARERGLPAIELAGGGSAFLGETSGTGRVAVAATTCGASPEMERRLAADAARVLKPEHERMAGILAAIRPKLEERFPDESLRSAIWQQILDSPVMVLLEADQDDAAAEMAERMAWGTG